MTDQVNAHDREAAALLLSAAADFQVLDLDRTVDAAYFEDQAAFQIRALRAAGWRPAPAAERPDDNPVTLLIDKALTVVDGLKDALREHRPAKDGGTRGKVPDDH